MTTPDPDQARLEAAVPSRAAALVNAAADPAPVLLGGLFAVTAHVTPAARAAGWTALAAAFCIAIPYAVLLLLVRRGRVADRHIVVRGERLLPFAVALASTLTGLGVLVLAGAPRPLVALLGCGLLAFVGIIAISVRSKASVHTGVATAVGTALALEFGGWVLAFAVPAAAAVGWARVRAGRHTGWQVVTGAAVAAAAVAAGYPVLR